MYSFLLYKYDMWIEQYDYFVRNNHFGIEKNICYLQTVTLTVGESCDTEMSIRFGHDIGKYHCAGRATQVLEARCKNILFSNI